MATALVLAEAGCHHMSALNGVGRSPFGIAVGIGIGAAVMVAAAEVAAVLFPPTQVWPRLAVVSIAVAGYAANVADAHASLTTAGLGYLLFSGFLVNRYGELTWDGTAGRHVIVFAAASGIGVGRWWIRTLAAGRDLDDELDQLVATHEEKESHGG